jgi:molecular chaperone HscB
VDETVGPFALLGLEPAARVDQDELRRRLLRFGRIVHPDFFGSAPPELRQRAERASARLNAAHETLSDERQRLAHLVERLGGPSESEERSMPREFLLEVLEWNEALEEARAEPAGSPLSPRLLALADTWRGSRREALARATDRLDPLPAADAPDLADRLTAVRRELNAVRYLDRALRELEALRLARAAG